MLLLGDAASSHSSSSSFGSLGERAGGAGVDPGELPGRLVPNEGGRGLKTNGFQEGVHKGAI